MAKHEMVNHTSALDHMDTSAILSEGWTLDRVWYSNPSPVWAIYDTTNPAGDRVLKLYRSNKELISVHPNKHTGTMFYNNPEARAKFDRLPEYVAETFNRATDLDQRRDNK